MWSKRRKNKKTGGITRSFKSAVSYSFDLLKGSSSFIYADNKSGAACATGYGEYAMRLCLCKYACGQMQSKKNSAPLTSKKSIDMLTKRFGGNNNG